MVQIEFTASLPRRGMEFASETQQAFERRNLRHSAILNASCLGIPPGRRRLETGTPSSEDQVDDDKRQDQTQAAAAVVTDTRAHVITAAAKEEKKDNKNKDERHGRAV